MRIHITHQLIVFAAAAALVSLAACGTAPTATSRANRSSRPRISATYAATGGDSSATLDAAEETSPPPGECDAALDETCRAIQPWY